MNFKKNFPNFAGGVVKFPPADCQVMGNSGHHVANLPGKSGGKRVGKPTKGKEDWILDVGCRILDVLNSAGGCPPDFRSG